jgi:histidine ammonia-lyase
MAIQIGEPLSITAVVEVATEGARVELPDAVRERVAACRAVVEDHLGPDKPLHYGINTGFGALAEVRIDDNQIRQLQHNLVRSHSCGVGSPLSESVVRAIMLLRAQVLALGYSGCRPDVIQQIVEFLNHGIHPVILEKGSVGASGDLAPLAHLALGLTGEGMVTYKGAEITAQNALDSTGLSGLMLQAKEGLCLINGTQAMTGMGVLLLARAEQLGKSCDLIGAMTVEALTDSRTAFDPAIHALRPYPGQQASAANLFALLNGSEIMDSHVDCGRVQDPYSLRCMPQVHGATRDSLQYLRKVLEVEINAVTDNPLVFADGRILSGGNFHGQPVAIALDLAAIGIAELANISERRIEQLVNPALSSGLPAFLAPNVGLNSGFMIAQVTAASLVSGNKRLAVPASVDSIPSSANREDHVSMGMHSAVKAFEVLENVETVLAIELMCAGQGIDLRRPLRSAPGVEAAHKILRKHVTKLENDRILYPDIQSALEVLRSPDLLASAEGVIGPLN